MLRNVGNIIFSIVCSEFHWLMLAMQNLFKFWQWKLQPALTYTAVNESRNVTEIFQNDFDVMHMYMYTQSCSYNLPTFASLNSFPYTLQSRSCFRRFLCKSVYCLLPLHFTLNNYLFHYTKIKCQQKEVLSGQTSVPFLNSMFVLGIMCLYTGK